MLPGFTAKSRDVRSRNLEPSVSPALAPTWIGDKRNGALITGLISLLVVRIIIPGFFDYPSDNPDSAVTSGLVDFFSNQLVWLTLLFVPLLLLRSRWALTLRLVGSVNRVLLVLLLYAGVSTLWSIDSG